MKLPIIELMAAAGWALWLHGLYVGARRILRPKRQRRSWRIQ